MLAVERLFDYTVPESLDGIVGIGTIVRVNLGGRRVRAWIVDDHVTTEAPPEKLRPLVAAVSAGPPPEIVDLTAWVAHHFAGPRLALLRAASPAAIVPPSPVPDRPSPPSLSTRSSTDDVAAEAVLHQSSVIRWPPAADNRDLLAELLAREGSTIVIVPEGRLGALATGLRATGATVVPWLVEGRPRDRARAWERARQGGCVVLGGRSAVLAPIPDLAAVVIVDDGSEALKEERSPTWHARDVAAERARRRGARLTIVSPAPPLEAPGPLLAPSRTVERAGWPITEVIDRRREPPGLGLFSSRTVAALRAAAQAGGRAVCVLNRKGRARLLACSACGELVRCERCEAAVSEVGDSADGVSRLGCSRCGATRPRVCARCGSTRLKVLRAGVSRVREELAALIPGVEVAMVDAATDELPKAPVLIGTEAVLHRVDPHPAGGTSVVAFLDFDAELLAPRFRAGEQALWLLVRAARLVGPRAGGGRVLVQTRLPRHEVLEAALHADPGRLADAERPRRKLLDLPPYAALARLTGDPAALTAAAGALRTAAPGVGVSGGASGGGGSGDAVLVRAPSPDALADALAVAFGAGRPAGRLRAEVDPLRL